MQLATYGFQTPASDVTNTGLRPSATSPVTKIASWLCSWGGSKPSYTSGRGVDGLRGDMLEDTGLWPDHAAVHRHHDPVLLALQVGSGGAL